MRFDDLNEDDEKIGVQLKEKVGALCLYYIKLFDFALNYVKWANK